MDICQRMNFTLFRQEVHLKIQADFEGIVNFTRPVKLSTKKSFV